jgi:kynurenine formamidase
MSEFILIEVSHPIEAGMKTYPNLPEPKMEVLLDYEESRSKYKHESEFHIASLHLCGNTGTYVDSPRHRYRDGMDLANLPLSNLAHLKTVVVDVTHYGKRDIGPECFNHLDLEDKAVLINTGWSRHWRTDNYFSNHPFLTGEACDVLIKKKVKFVGIDSLNIDDIEDMSRPAHTRLLGAGIPICEHMTNLSFISSSEAFLHAVPIAWIGGATFPVRAYIMLKR